jgi:hypothetical protein
MKDHKRRSQNPPDPHPQTPKKSRASRETNSSQQLPSHTNLPPHIAQIPFTASNHQSSPSPRQPANPKTQNTNLPFILGNFDETFIQKSKILLKLRNSLKTNFQKFSCVSQKFSERLNSDFQAEKIILKNQKNGQNYQINLSKKAKDYERL